MSGSLVMQRDASSHQPVLRERVTALLAVDREAASGPALVIDCTIGAAGHAAAVLAASHADTYLLGLDRDPDALALARRRLAAYADRITLVHAPFDELAAHAGPLARSVGPVMAVLYDLGVSSMQLDRGERGFSFRTDAPLDMRMDPTTGRSAADLVNTLDVTDLARILRDYGEERYALRIARAVVAARPLHTTAALAQTVASAVPAAARRQPIHPATRTFQALRIATNDELDRLSASLPQALGLVTKPGDMPPAPRPSAPRAGAVAARTGRGGRVAVLAYHSLEDRIVKRSFAEAARGCICPPDLPVCGCGRAPAVRPLTRGAERPDSAEVEANPRARSARLRAVERTAEPPPQGGR